MQNNNDSNNSNLNNNKENSTDNSEKKVKVSKKTSRFKKILKTFLISIFLIFLIATITVSGFIVAIIKTSPPLSIEAVKDLDQASQLYDSNGEFMDEVLTAEKRYVISLDDMPSNLPNAFVAIEDERFYEHSGVDLKRIFGALVTDIKKILNKQTGLHGASTITQQVIKNNILTNEVSITRKIREIYLALELEKQMSKKDILQVYLNTIFVGGNAYGVEAGALQYFSKNAKDLTLAQSAFLAGATQHPTKYYSSAVNPEESQFYKNRTTTVLNKMLELGYITKEDHDNALNEVLNDQLGFNIKSINNSYNYEWFSRPVVEELTKDLKEVYGYTDEEIKLHLRNDGLKIYTTMDKKLQDHSQNVLDNALTHINLGQWTDDNGIVQPQMASVVIDFKTGHVKSIIGGRGEQKANSYNRAASNNFLRSIGSTTKPLTSYTPLIDLKLGHAGTGVEDSPLSKELSKKYGGWQPTNEVKGNFIGYTNVRYSLERSINLSSIKIVDYVGIENALEYGKKFGLHYNDNSKSSIATLALGQFNNDPNNLDGGNPLILASAYSVFANGGIKTEPITYTHVVDKNGKVILENIPEKTQVVSPETAYIMYDLLKGPVERYSSRPAKFGDIPVAGKTGTTENNKDLWFAGITPYLAGAVWIGADRPTELKDKYGKKPFSGSTASALFGKIMAVAHESLPPVDIPRPEDIVSASICSVSGLLATPYCAADPRGSKVYTEIFTKGTVPTQKCNIHIPVTVNSLTGAIATANTPNYLRETRIFLDRKYTPSVYLSDQKYVTPKIYDDQNYEIMEDTHEKDEVEPDEQWFDKDHPEGTDPSKDPNKPTDGTDSENKPNVDQNNQNTDNKPNIDQKPNTENKPNTDQNQDTTIKPEDSIIKPELPEDSSNITKPDNNSGDSNITKPEEDLNNSETIVPSPTPDSENIVRPDSNHTDTVVPDNSENNNTVIPNENTNNDTIVPDIVVTPDSNTQQNESTNTSTDSTSRNNTGNLDSSKENIQTITPEKQELPKKEENPIVKPENNTQNEEFDATDFNLG